MNQRLISPSAKLTIAAGSRFVQNTLKGIPFLVILGIGLSLGGCNSSTDKKSSQHLFQAETYLKQGQLSAAAIEARNAMQYEATQEKATLVLGEVALTMGDAPGAIEMIGPLKSKDALFIKARALIELDQYDEAASLLEKYKSTLALSPDYFVLLGEIALAENNLEQARSLFNEALKLSPEYKPALHGMANLALTETNKEEVINWLNQAVGEDKTYTPALITQGEFYLRSGQPSVAEEALSSALINLNRFDLMTPEKYLTMSYLAQSFIDQGRTSEALNIRKQLKQSPQGKLKARIEQAVNAYTEGDLAKAVTAFEDVLTIAPKHKKTSLALGMLKYQEGDIEAAEHLLQQATDDNDEISAKTYQVLTVSRMKLKKNSEAQDILQQGLAAYPDNTELLILSGLIDFNQGTTDKAQTTLKQVIQAEPTNGVALTLLGNIEIRQQNPKQARELFKQAIASTPDLKDAYQGYISTYPKNSKQPLISLQKLVEEQKPPTAEGQLALGVAMLAAGEYSQAKTHSELILQKMPEQEARAKRLLGTAEYFLALNAIKASQPQKTFQLLKSSLKNTNELPAAAAVLTKVGLEINKVPETQEVIENFAQNTRYKSLAYELLADIQLHEKQPAQAVKHLEDAWNQAQNFRIAMKLYKAQTAAQQPTDVTQKYIKQWHQQTEKNYRAQNNTQTEQAYEQSLFALTSIFEREQQNTQAIENYRKLLTMKPDSALYLNNLAWLLFVEKEADALEVARKAYKNAPQTPEVIDTLGWILVQQGQQIEGVTLLEKALSIDPSSQVIQKHLKEAKN